MLRNSRMPAIQQVELDGNDVAFTARSDLMVKITHVLRNRSISAHAARQEVNHVNVPSKDRVAMMIHHE